MNTGSVSGGASEGAREGSVPALRTKGCWGPGTGCSSRPPLQQPRQRLIPSYCLADALDLGDAALPLACLSFPSRRHIRAEYPRGVTAVTSACSVPHHQESKKREQRGPCEHHRHPSAVPVLRPLQAPAQPCTDLERVLPADVVGGLHGRHAEAEEGDAAQDTLLLLIWRPNAGVTHTEGLEAQQRPRSCRGDTVPSLLPVGGQATCGKPLPACCSPAALPSLNSLLNYSCPPSAALPGLSQGAARRRAGCRH